MRGYDDLLFDPAAISLIYSGFWFLESRLRGFPKTRRQFLFLCQTVRATRSTSFSCRGHMPEGMGPLTRESSARADGFMNTKMPLHNADQTLFLYPILNYESLLLVCWIPACAGMTIFAWSISIMPPTETCSEFLEIPLRGYDNLLFVSTVIPTINPYV